jgi:hypothetical protein
MATSANLPDLSWQESISLRVVSRARISARPESAPVSREIARVFGLNLPALLGHFDPDTFLLKTSQACLIDGQCQELSENWPDSGMWDAGSAYELQTSARRISASESSSWPTPDAQLMNDGADPQKHAERQARLREKHNNGNGAGTPLGMFAKTWPTPRREDGESCGNHPNSQGDSLTGMTKLWRTPDAAGEGGPRNRQSSIGDGHQVTIAEQAEHWATLNAHDGTGARGKGFELTDCHYKPHDLAGQTDSWKTPHGMSNKDHKGKTGGCGGGEFAKQSYQNRSGTSKGEQLQNFVAHSLPDPMIPDGPISSESSPDLPRRLNPQFVEWLMGFPIGWSKP